MDKAAYCRKDTKQVYPDFHVDFEVLALLVVGAYFPVDSDLNYKVDDGQDESY